MMVQSVPNLILRSLFFFAQNEYTEAGASAGCLRCLQLSTKGKSSIKNMRKCPFKLKSCPSKLSDGNPEASIDFSAVEDINAEKSVIVSVQKGSITKKPILADNLHVTNMLKHVACDVASLTTQEPYLSIEVSSGMLEGTMVHAC
jgi:hypothetical protein